MAVNNPDLGRLINDSYIAVHNNDYSTPRRVQVRVPRPEGGYANNRFRAKDYNGGVRTARKVAKAWRNEIWLALWGFPFPGIGKTVVTPYPRAPRPRASNGDEAKKLASEWLRLIKERADEKHD